MRPRRTYLYTNICNCPFSLVKKRCKVAQKKLFSLAIARKLISSWLANCCIVAAAKLLRLARDDFL